MAALEPGDSMVREGARDGCQGPVKQNGKMDGRRSHPEATRGTRRRRRTVNPPGIPSALAHIFPAGSAPMRDAALFAFCVAKRGRTRRHHPEPRPVPRAGGVGDDDGARMAPGAHPMANGEIRVGWPVDGPSDGTLRPSPPARQPSTGICPALSWKATAGSTHAPPPLAHFRSGGRV